MAATGVTAGGPRLVAPALPPSKSPCGILQHAAAPCIQWAATACCCGEERCKDDGDDTASHRLTGIGLGMRSAESQQPTGTHRCGAARGRLSALEVATIMLQASSEPIRHARRDSQVEIRRRTSTRGWSSAKTSFPDESGCWQPRTSGSAGSAAHSSSPSSRAQRPNKASAVALRQSPPRAASGRCA